MPTITIQSFWHGALSDVERASMASFLHHGHEYHLYCYDKPADVPPGVVIRDAGEIMPKSSVFYHEHGAERGSITGFVDLFRYKLLRIRGGWWCDTDMICMQPFKQSEKAIVATEYNHDFGHVPTNSALFVPFRDHELIVRLDTAATAKYKQLGSKLRFAQLGPPMIAAIVNEISGGKHWLAHPEAYCPINYFDVDLLFEPGMKLPITSSTFTIHLWNELWRRRAIDKTKLPETCPASRLINGYLRP